MNLILLAFAYVVNDPWFWPAMAFTVMTGIYIGAGLFNGDRTEIKKALITLGSLVALILATNLPRIMANNSISPTPERSFASSVTTLLVSVFYLSGIWLGVKIVNRAHKK